MKSGCFLILALGGIVAGSSPSLAETLPSAFCQALTKHTPEASIEYQPGVDAYGRKVPSADYEGQKTLHLPEKITIPLTAGLREVLKFETSNYPFNSLGRTDINLGELAVEGGQVTYNGQPLSDTEQDTIAVLCMQPDRSSLKQRP